MTALLGATALPAAASAANRYAAPGGTSITCLTPATPCDLPLAITGAANGDDVTLAGGTYGPYTTAISTTHNLTVHGSDPANRPVVTFTSGAGSGLTLDSDTGSLTDVAIVSPGSGSALTLGGDPLAGGMIAERVFVQGDGGTTCNLQTDSLVMRDSVCWNTHAGGIAIAMQRRLNTASATLRNVTAYASGGSNSIGLQAKERAGLANIVDVTVTNSILHGTGVDLKGDNKVKPNSSVTVTLDHSNYATVTPLESTITPAGDPTNQTAASSLVDPANGDFHQLAGSVTVDAGANDAANGSLDYDGQTRTISGTTDIGADELVAAPVVTTDPATDISGTDATLHGTVNPGGAATTYVFEWGTTTAYGTTTTVGNLPVGIDPVDVSAALSGLLPGVTYHYRLSATNSTATTPGGDQEFTTAVVAPVVLTGAATAVTQTGATLNGNVNPGGGATTYAFQYGTTAAYGTTTTVVNLPAGNDPVDVSATVSGLAPATTYHVRITATNAAGTTNGSDQTFTTATVPVDTSGGAGTGSGSGSGTGAGTDTGAATGEGGQAGVIVKASRVGIAKQTRRVAKRNRVKVTLSCSKGNGRCVGELRITLRRRVKGHLKTVTLGRKRFSLAPGARGSVTVTLNRSGRALLKKAGKRGLKARAVARTTVNTASAAFSVRPAARKR